MQHAIKIISAHTDTQTHIHLARPYTYSHRQRVPKGVWEKDKVLHGLDLLAALHAAKVLEECALCAASSSGASQQGGQVSRAGCACELLCEGLMICSGRREGSRLRAFGCVCVGCKEGGERVYVCLCSSHGSDETS